jgi:multiple sugar transport system substrate-binding protein
VPAGSQDEESNRMITRSGWFSRLSRTSVVAATVGATVLAAGCSSSGGGKSATSTDPSKPYAGQTIVVDYFSAPPGKALLDAFTAQTGIKVQWNQFQFDNLQTKIQTAMSAKVYFADVTDLGLLRLGLFTRANWYTPLEKYIAPSSLDSEVPLAKGWVVNGHLVGVPVDGQVAATTINMAMLKKAGITTAPATFSDFEADLKTVQQKGVSAHPLDIPFAASEGLSTQWWSYTMAMGGQILDDDNAPAFSDPSSAGYKAFDWMVQAYKSGLVPPQNINYTDVQSQQAEMARGVTVANLADYTDNVDTLYNNAKLSSVVGQVQYAPTPGVDGPAPNEEFPDGMVVPSTAKHAGAAAEFIKYLVSAKPNAQINGLDGDDYAIPGWAGPAVNVQSMSLLKNAGKLPGADALQQQLASAKPAFPQGAPAWYPQFADAAYQALRDAAQGHTSVASAISSLAKTVDGLRSSS